MKKFFFVFIPFIAIAWYGCLGSTAEDIVGTWRLAPVDPNSEDIQMQINANGTLTITDLGTGESDAGTYDLKANTENNRFNVYGISDTMFWTPWNGEWHILALDDSAFIIAVKGPEYGGVWQRDFMRQ